MATKRWKGGKSRKGGKGIGGANLGRSDKPTPREMKVIDRYFTNGYVKREALAFGGYNSPETNTWAFFARPAVKAEIERRQARLRQKFEINEDNIIQELAAIGFARLSNLMEIQEDGNATVDLRNLTEAEKAAVSEFTVDEYVEGKGDEARTVKKTKIKFHDKGSALERLMRHLGMFKDKVEIGAGQDLVALLMAGRKQASITKE